MKKNFYILFAAVCVAIGCSDDDEVVFTKATVKTQIVDELVQNNPTNEQQNDSQNNSNTNTANYIEIAACDAANYISSQTSDECFLSLTGELTQEIVDAIGVAMRSNNSLKVNLDLSKTSGYETTSSGRILNMDYSPRSSGLQDCDGLISIIMPKSLKNIGDYAFANCKRLKNITLNEGIEIIGSYAFTITETGYYSSVLESVNIPSSVNAIGTCAFGYNFGSSSINFSIADPYGWYYTESKVYWEYKDDGTPLDKLTSEILNDGGIWQSTDDGKQTLKQAYFYKL